MPADTATPPLLSSAGLPHPPQDDPHAAHEAETEAEASDGEHCQRRQRATHRRRSATEQLRESALRESALRESALRAVVARQHLPQPGVARAAGADAARGELGADAGAIYLFSFHSIPLGAVRSFS